LGASAYRQAVAENVPSFGSIIAKSSHATRITLESLGTGIHLCAHHIVQCALPKVRISEQLPTKRATVDGVFHRLIKPVK
jgi:hypothetical protein